MENVPLNGPLLLASNHQSFLDPILVAVALRREVHFMARDSLFKGRVFKPLIEYLNAFPVKRGMADIAAVRAILRRLEMGACVTTFPEATRTADGRVADCRGGIMIVAQRAGVPIVPVAIEGAFDAWPRTRKLPRPAKIWVEYGPAIMPEQLAGLSNDAGADLITQTIRSLHNQLRSRMNREAFGYDEDPPA